MAEPWMVDDSAESKAAAIREAALGLFWRYSYHGTSVRQIGKAAGISVANVYHYYPSKIDLLYDIVARATDLLNETSERAIQAADDDPISQYSALVGAHVRFHTEFQREGVVGNSELRSFSEPLYGRYVAKRDEQEARFRRAIDRGIQQGVFNVPHPHEAVLAVVPMLTSIALWYRPGGELTQDEIVERFTQLSLRMLGA